jgi:hypothetical protein
MMDQVRADLDKLNSLRARLRAIHGMDYEAMLGSSDELDPTGELIRQIRRARGVPNVGPD